MRMGCYCRKERLGQRLPNVVVIQWQGCMVKKACPKVVTDPNTSKTSHQVLLAQRLQRQGACRFHQESDTWELGIRIR